MAKKQAPAKTETAVEGAEAEFDFGPIGEQGEQAKGLGLSADACPYAEGSAFRAAWLAGYGE